MWMLETNGIVIEMINNELYLSSNVIIWTS